MNKSLVKEVWDKEYLEILKNRISKESYLKMTNEINAIIDEKQNNHSKIIIENFIPKNYWTNETWNEAFTLACLSDYSYATQFLGLMICQELILRKETWYFKKNTKSLDMIYFTV